MDNPIATLPTRAHFLSGRNFHAELRGRIELDLAERSGWIRLSVESGTILLKDQIIEVDGSAL